MMAVSSAKRDSLPPPGRGGISAVKILKSIGPRTLPWGTPAGMFDDSE